MLLDTRPWGNYLTDYRRFLRMESVGKLAMPKIKFGFDLNVPLIINDH
jgi:hypothetical protein